MSNLLSFRPDLNILAIGCGDGSIKLYDYKNNKIISHHQGNFYLLFKRI